MTARTKKDDDRRNRWRRAYPKLLALWRPALKVALAAGLFVEVAGCSRPFYRKRADNEVSEVLAQKDKYPDWGIDNWHVYPDPKARFADTGDPDHPAKPPDDCAAYALSPNPQSPGKAGVARLEGTGYLELIAKWDLENRERRAREEAEDEKKRVEESTLPPSEEEEEAATDVQPGAVAQADIKAVAKVGPGFGQDTAILKVSTVQAAADATAAKGPPVQTDVIAQAKAPSSLDLNGRPAYLLTLEQAAELAMFNSREYEDQRENLYLAALPVTQERFAFMSQFFAAQQATRALAGREAAGGPANNWSLNNGVGLSKILPTGALLLLNFSNQTVFDFLNPKSSTSVTMLNFNAIQPLLRNGGEAVALESLTQAERNLLYQIRNYARFRKELYVAIASNNGGAISGGSFQPTGTLSSNVVTPGAGLGASGLTPGVIGLVATTRTGPLVGISSPGTLALQNAITPPPSGYLNTMLQKVQVYIDQENIDVLSNIVLRYRGLLEGDLVAPLQVQQVEQQLLTGRFTLLTDQADYPEVLNAFKLAIGAPMRLQIDMDDSEVQPLLKQFRKARAIGDSEQAALDEASALLPLENAPRLRAELLRLFRTSALVRGTPFREQIAGRWAELEKLSDADLRNRLEALHKDAQKMLDAQTELQRQDQLPSAEDQARLKAINAQLDLGNLERNLRLYEAEYVSMGKPKPPAPGAERKRFSAFQAVVYSWQKVLVEARDYKWAAVRTSWPELPRACVNGVDLVHDDVIRAEATADQYALTHRLDLMNVRGQVVDAWRQLAVYANALLGTFTVQYQLNASSPVGGNQPLNIGGSGNAHQLILNTELPLVRIQERNNYRASQIAYQRQRRALQEAEDLAVQAVEGELIELRQLAEQYKIQQRQLELAYLTIDSSLESLQAPVAPPAPVGLPSRTNADGPAALTQQLLTAQRSLPTAQQALLTIWINYLDQRLQLYRDLELMPLDARGVWIDQIRDCDCGIKEEPAAGGPQLLPVPQPAAPGGEPKSK